MHQLVSSGYSGGTEFCSGPNTSGGGAFENTLTALYPALHFSTSSSSYGALRGTIARTFQRSREKVMKTASTCSIAAGNIFLQRLKRFNFELFDFDS
jgi:hypothetical protein